MVAGLVAGMTSASEGSNDPPVSIRQLARRVSNPDASVKDDVEEEQRKSIWAQAQSLRKKRSQLALWSGKTPESLKTLLDKTAGVNFEKGKLNQCHRLWVISCDLALEAKGSWQRPPLPKQDTLQPIFKCLKNFPMKEYDIVICFDRCGSENKPVLREGMCDNGKLLEFVIIFQSRVRQGRQCKIFCGASKVKTAIMKLFVPRVRVSVKERDDDYIFPVAMESAKKSNGKKSSHKVTTHDLTSLPLGEGQP